MDAIPIPSSVVPKEVGTESKCADNKTPGRELSLPKILTNRFEDS